MRSAILFLVPVFLASDLLAQVPSEPDLSFGPNGTVVITDPFTNVRSLEVDASQRVVALVVNDDVFALDRFTNEGVLDATFGANGRFVLDDQLRPNDMVLDSEGRILLAGHAISANAELPRHRFVARVLPDGGMDPTFGSGGILFPNHTNITVVNTYRSLALSPNGMIIIGGSLGNDPAYLFGLVERIGEDGVVDLSFGEDGIVVTGTPLEPGSWMSVALTADEKIRLGGTDDQGNMFILGLTPDGSIDTEFAADGTFHLAEAAPDLLTSAFGELRTADDGTLICSGDGRKSMDGIVRPGALVVKLNANGSLSTDFGQGGTTFIPFATAGDPRSRIRVLMDGGVLFTHGYSGDGPGPFGYTRMCLMHLFPDGSLDGSIGFEGRITYAGSSLAENYQDLELTSDGGAILGGYILPTLPYQQAVLYKLRPREVGMDDAGSLGSGIGLHTSGFLLNTGNEIQVDLPRAGNVIIELVDLLGRRSPQASVMLPAGRSTVQFDLLGGSASGVYLLEMTALGQRAVVRCVR